MREQIADPIDNFYNINSNEWIRSMTDFITDQQYIAEYLRDESRLEGRADSISFPRSEEEILEIAADTEKRGMPLTIQGSRTGITGGAVPLGGHILNLSRMNRVLGMRQAEHDNAFYLSVEPGLKLQELNRVCAARDFDTTAWDRESLAALEVFGRQGAYFFPPDPTETSASIGGMVSCNASGARTLFYGSTRNYIHSLHIILAGGHLLILTRGRERANRGSFTIRTQGNALHAPHTFSGRIPSYKIPEVKNAAGYFSGENAELIDLFIGSEGTLGIVSLAELRLIPAPPCVWGGIFFFSAEMTAVGFTELIRTDGYVKVKSEEGTSLAAMEFYDARALSLASTLPTRDFPLPPEGAAAALYVEFHGRDEEAVGACFIHLAGLLEHMGENPELNWLAANPTELGKLCAFRHAVPEAVNLLVDKNKKEYRQLTKLGTDMAVADDKLAEVYELYRSVLAPSALDYTLFGHIGNNHLHANIIPHNQREYDLGKSLYLQMARSVLEMGGTISAEHGIGKLKTELLKAMYGEQGLAEMMALKTSFDPHALLNRGNLWESGARP
jgi:D-lactate dehydrogenase (cytochrome)